MINITSNKVVLTIDYLDKKYKAELSKIQTHVGITYQVKIFDTDLIKKFNGQDLFYINPTIPNGLNVLKWDDQNREFQYEICVAIFMHSFRTGNFISFD